METYTLSNNTNYTDPKVVFDPTFLPTKVAVTWDPNDVINDNIPYTGRYKTNVDFTRFDGIVVPIVKVNTQVIPNEDIQYVCIHYTSFKPSLELIIKNENYLKLETPGMANKITVIFVPVDQGTYKNVSVDFYITNMIHLGTSVRYSGEYLFPNLETKTTRVLKTPEESKLTTYQLLEFIAKECKLGFSATDKCKDIKDNKVRLARNQNVQEIIKQHIKFSGLDDKSYFDAWIDVYGYIVMCNLSWVMDESVAINDLSIHRLVGSNILDASDFTYNPIKYKEATFRTITNWKIQTENNLNIIESYEWIVDNQSLKSHGTDNLYYAINHYVKGGVNLIDSKNIKIEEDTADGNAYKKVYNFQKNKYIGAEMASQEDGNTPVLFQEKSRDAYLIKLNNQKLKVTMRDINLAYQRGTLINVSIYEYDRDTKIQMTKLFDNLAKSGSTSEIPSIDILNGELKQKVLENQNFGIINLSVSGMYYIDGIDYIYDENKNKCYQILYLIRKYDFGTYLNISSKSKIF